MKDAHPSAGTLAPRTAINPTPDFATAVTAFQVFLQRLPRDGRITALFDCDGDGVAAGVVWLRSMERLGFSNLTGIIPDRERNAWSTDNKAKVAATNPEYLFVLDLGSQPVPVAPGVPTCYIDHHQPEGVPPDDTVICAYPWDPIPNTSLLVYQLFAEVVDVTDLDWVAAIGIINDLGDQAPFELLAQMKKRHTAKYLKEATVLLNAVRRCGDYTPEVAFAALLNHASPRALVGSTSPEVGRLHAARAEVKVAMEQAKKAAPIFSGKVALVRLNSPCQVHPLIAQIWRSRLPRNIVIVANEGYMPGQVKFSVRAAPGNNVLEFLRNIPLPPGEGHFGHGHDQASGGSLPFARWNALLGALGFPETAYVS